MDFLTHVRKAIEAYRSGDYLCALKCATEALSLALETIHPDHNPPVGSGDPCKDLDDCVQKLEAACPDNEAMQAFPWETLLPILLDFARLLIDRLRPRV